MSFDRASSSQALQLRNYIDNDTPGLGLSFTKTNGATRRLMESASTESGATVSLTAAELQAAVDGPELVALPDGNRASWQSLLTAAGAEGVDLNSTGIDSQVSAIWSTSPVTSAAVDALKSKSSISYSEHLFGVGTVLGKTDIHAIRPSS